MTAIPDSSPAVAPNVIAGLLLAAREHLRRLELPHPSVEEVVEKTGACRSRAYELKDELLSTLPSLARLPGRPAEPVSASPPSATDALSREVVRLLMDRPGCVHGGPQRRRYSDSFRRHVLELRQRHTEIPLERFAEAVGVPLPTLEDWLRAPPPDAQRPKPQPAQPTARGLQIETLLAAWKSWDGSFEGFCDHAQHHLRIPFGRTLIAHVLESHGVRSPCRRPGRSPDEIAMRRAFQTFFPGAQWVGDGTPVPVHFQGERFLFNLELSVDACSGAVTGASVRDAEDGAALVQAVADGEATTGKKPLAVLVDHRPSNLTSEVERALEPTLLIPATLGRAQNKGHVEGAFGLFFQRVPPLSIQSRDRREAARQLLRLVVATWGRTLNHRPRRDRGGRSRFDLYQQEPTAEELERARVALKQRCHLQKIAQETLRARQDPVARRIIQEAFTRLSLADATGNLATAIARYPLSPIADGIAIFEGKRAAGSLPSGVDGRYLLGIVRNIAEEREAELVCEAMLRARLRAQDLLVTPLEARCKAEREQARDIPGLLAAFVEHGIDADRQLDRLFWLGAAGDLIRNTAAEDRPALFRLGSRRIYTTTRVPYRERLKAARFFAHKALPLE